jgi:drug/metabolite transporter superfamily protein YnfA
MHDLPRTLALFAITAVAEIVGCYLPLLWVSGRARAWVLLKLGLATSTGKRRTGKHSNASMN